MTDEELIEPTVKEAFDAGFLAGVIDARGVYTTEELRDSEIIAQSMVGDAYESWLAERAAQKGEADDR